VTGLTVTQTSAGTAQTYLTSGSVVYTGSQIIVVSFYCNQITPGPNQIFSYLSDSTTPTTIIATLCTLIRGGAALVSSGFAQYRFTPSAGAHTYLVKTFVDAGSGSLVGASNGPSFLRITTA
jgi:hypothetical protein